MTNKVYEQKLAKGWFAKNQYIGGKCLKKGVLDSLQTRRGLAKKRGDVFEGG